MLFPFQVYSYYRSLPMPMTSYKFGSVDPISGNEYFDDNGQFVSSVCWRKKSNMLVAANSTGNMKLLKLVWHLWASEFFWKTNLSSLYLRQQFDLNLRFCPGKRWSLYDRDRLWLATKSQRSWSKKKAVYVFDNIWFFFICNCIWDESSQILRKVTQIWSCTNKFGSMCND